MTTPANHAVFLLTTFLTKTKKTSDWMSHDKAFIYTRVDILRCLIFRLLRTVNEKSALLEIRSTIRLTRLFDYSCEPRGVSAYYISYQNKKDIRLDVLFVLVGEGGFEPPKSLTTDLQSAPFGHSGTLPHIKPTITVGLFGAGGRTRTPDLLITNQLLYQLSYTSEFLTLDYNTIWKFICQLFFAKKS